MVIRAKKKEPWVIQDRRTDNSYHSKPFTPSLYRRLTTIYGEWFVLSADRMSKLDLLCVLHNCPLGDSANHQGHQSFVIRSLSRICCSFPILLFWHKAVFSAVGLLVEIWRWLFPKSRRQIFKSRRPMSKWRHFSVGSGHLIFSPLRANFLDEQGISLWKPFTGTRCRIIG